MQIKHVKRYLPFHLHNDINIEVVAKIERYSLLITFNSFLELLIPITDQRNVTVSYHRSGFFLCIEYTDLSHDFVCLQCNLTIGLSVHTRDKT